jgi:transposase
MDSVKYIGLDVHRDTISVAVVDQSGRLVMRSVIPTQASAILDCVSGIQGSLHVTLEEGTHSAWLYDLLVQRVKKLVVCNPRKNALLKSGSKSDAIDARKLAELLRAGMLSPVYHGENSALEVQHLGLLRTSAGDSRQRRILRGQRAGGTQKEAGIGARIELEP